MRTRTQSVNRFAALAGVMLLASAASAQFTVPNHAVTNGGGTTCGGAGFSLSGSIGQEAAGPTTGPMIGGNFSLSGGLWPAASIPLCPGDANVDGQVNFADITNVLANFNAMYTCGQADRGDADNNGVVNFADVTEVLKNFGLPCP